MGFIHSVAALLVTLGILITFHEFGHFWVARRCGVKVLRFSIGFGKPLLRWQGKDGTEYVIAALPLGGYVKMLDEREGKVPPELAHQSFNSKSLRQRFAIVAAGPLANFLLALVTYWFIFILGTQVAAPIVGAVTAESAAEVAGLKAGDEILSVAGRTTPGWQDVGLNLVAHMGETTSVAVVVQNQQDSYPRELNLRIHNFLSGQQNPDPFTSLGLRPWSPPIPAVIGSIQAGGAADRAGLRPGDRIKAVNNQAIEDWSALVQQLQSHPGQEITLQLLRSSQTGVFENLTLNITPASRQLEDGRTVGFIGAGVEMPEWPQEYLREHSFGPLAAVNQALQKTAQMSWLTVSSLGKMVAGLISPSNLSGPITIARVASDTAKSGWESYFSFLAYVSISLGILNLLPIPVLDGGHLLFYTLEAIRRKPVTERIQEAATRVGLLVLGSLMVMAFYFDLMRL